MFPNQSSTQGQGFRDYSQNKNIKKTHTPRKIPSACFSPAIGNTGINHVRFYLPIFSFSFFFSFFRFCSKAFRGIRKVIVAVPAGEKIGGKHLLGDTKTTISHSHTPGNPVFSAGIQTRDHSCTRREGVEF